MAVVQISDSVAAGHVQHVAQLVLGDEVLDEALHAVADLDRVGHAAKLGREFKGLFGDARPVFVAGALVLVILALIAVTMVVKAWPAFSSQGLSYFTGDVWDPQSNTFGTLAFGQGLSVTAVQAASVYATIANGGQRADHAAGLVAGLHRDDAFAAA